MAFFSKRYHPVGTPPGTLTRPAQASAEPLRIRLVDFDKDHVEVLDNVTAAQCEPYLNRNTVTWVHVHGHPDESVLRQLGSSFGLHSLALEDVLNAGQRPKVDAFTDQLFVVVALPLVKDGRICMAQVSLFLGGTSLVSFCEQHGELFKTVVERLREPGSRLRRHGADYLLYSLLDIVVDQGFPVLERFGQQLDELEIQILASAGADTLERIHSVRRELIMLRGLLWPHREVINRLLHDDDGFIKENSRLYLRDCYDHSIQIIDLLETYREIVASMLEIYLSSVSYRMNETMRLLTVIATVFIPLTFIVGVYGMNFDPDIGRWSMPELRQPLGYLTVWLVMAVIALVMLLYFRHKRWF